MDDSLNIKIIIMQRPYYIKVSRQDEALFRKAGSSIEESVQRYASKSGVYRDKQDLLAMALLESTLAYLRTKQENNKYKQEPALAQKLEQMDSFLSDALNEK